MDLIVYIKKRKTENSKIWASKDRNRTEIRTLKRQKEMTKEKVEISEADIK